MKKFILQLTLFALMTISSMLNAQQVGPLLTTTWGPGAPYNTQCPWNSYAGCGPVAMAQIMKYHNWPANGRDSITWPGQPNGANMTVNMTGSAYNWADMPNAITTGSPSSQIQAIATLMLHAGASTQTWYSTGSSASTGTSFGTLAYGLVSFFNYSYPTYIKKSDFTEAEWIAAIKAEIDAGRPVLYRGDNAISSGHIWVADGYKGDSLHFNWGWYGQYNGYYHVNNINPPGHDYTSNQVALT